MLLNDVRLHKNSSVALTTGGLSLAVGAMLLSLSAISVYRLNQAQEITINTSSWNWMSEVQLRLDAGQEALGPTLGEAEIPEHLFVGPLAPVFASAQKSAPKAKAHSKWIAKAKSVLRRAKKPRPEPETKAVILSQRDEIKSTAAAPQVEAAPASLSELSILQGLHSKLRGQFLLALNTQPQTAPGEEKVLVAQAKESQEREPAVAEKAAVEVAPEPTTIHSLRHRKQEQMRAQALVQPAEIVETKVNVTTQDEEAPKSTDELASIDEKGTQGPEDHLADERVDQIHTLQAAPTSDYSPELTAPQAPKAESKAEASKGESGKILVSNTSQTIWVTPSIVPVQTKTPPTAVTTQPTQSKAPSAPVAAQSNNGDSKIVAAVDTHQARNVLRSLNSTAGASDYSRESVTTQASTFLQATETYVEAFDWVSPLSGATKSYFTKEESGQAAGWVLSQAPDHWPTLSRESTRGTPLISNNTSKLLSTLSGAVLQSEAGIVFGKVPAGWSVRLSGRSERPVFLNDRNQTVTPSSLEGERYFAFLNVAPGAHLMYLVNRMGAEEGAIGIASIGGTATFVDLSSIRKTSVSGRVYDGSEFQARSMNGITVRVLGALSARTETSRAGRFTIENVLTVGDYPVYVETDAQAGYTHRYQLSPSQLADVKLYRLNEATIQTWIGQLEGAISPDSGIVVAAVPGVIKGQGLKAKLSPVVQSLAANPTLRPEVYTLSAAGQMQVGQVLDAQSSRFVSVQVPEGPAITRVVDAERSPDKNLIWSEMIMVSPAVINVVGPY